MIYRHVAIQNLNLNISIVEFNKLRGVLMVVTAECSNCKQPFSFDAHLQPHRKFCCLKCQKSSQKKRLKRRKKAGLVRKPNYNKALTCKFCQKPFYLNRHGSRNRIYCSPCCAEKAKKSRMAKTDLNKFYTCPNCDEEFKQTGRGAPKKFCSTHCRKSYHDGKSECAYCHQPVPLKTKYCSNICKVKDTMAKEIPEETPEEESQVNVTALRDDHKEQLKPELPKTKSQNIKTESVKSQNTQSVCLICGARGDWFAEFCSIFCKKKWKARQVRCVTCGSPIKLDHDAEGKEYYCFKHRPIGWTEN